MAGSSQCPLDLGKKPDASIVAAEAVQMTAAVVHILLELDHFRERGLWGTASTDFVTGTLSNVVADDIEACGRLGLLFRPVDCKTTGLRWM
jgi:hypothetical protein